MKNVLMFSGQGSQYFHMGAELLEHHPGFGHVFARRSEAASDILGESLTRILYDPSRGKSEEFSDPRRSNVALLTIECALAQVLRDEGIGVDLVCGMSLGEYAAAVVAEVLDFEVALRLVADTGRCFSDHCEPGGMLAVLDTRSRFAQTPAARHCPEVIFESPGKHFVLAGSTAQVAAVERELRRSDIVVQSLPVAHGYHSSNIDPAREAFEAVVADASFRPPRVPLYSSVGGRCIDRLDATHLWRVAREPMRFLELIESLPDDHSYRLIDVGPTGTMANLVRHHARRHRSSKIFALITPFANGHLNLAKLVEHVAPAVVPAVSASATVTASPALPVVAPRRAHLFPGQGSQRRGMGAGLFARHPELVAQADAVLGYSVERLCVEDPDGNLGNTEYTQPALFVVNALLHREQLLQGPPPAFVAGHSLGEYSALHAAGGLDFETGLRLVQRRGTLMARARGGGMAAVLGLSEREVEQILERHHLHDLDLANINSPTQIVVSGPEATIRQARQHFQSAGCRQYIPLNVSGAFHSRSMQSAAERFADFLRGTRFGRLRIPVVANVSGRPYQDGAIAQTLVQQITRPVRWTQTVAYLESEGVREFVEVGPGHVLERLVAACREPGSAASARRPTHPSGSRAMPRGARAALVQRGA